MTNDIRAQRKNPSEILQELRRRAFLEEEEETSDWVLRLDDTFPLLKKRNKKLPCVVCVARRTVSESSSSNAQSKNAYSSSACCSAVADAAVEDALKSTIVLDLDWKSRRVLGCEIRGNLDGAAKQEDFNTKFIDEICHRSEREIINTLLDSAAQCSAELSFSINDNLIRTNAKAIKSSTGNGSSVIKLECLVIGITCAPIVQARSVPPVSLSSSTTPMPIGVTYNEKPIEQEFSSSSTPSDALTKLCDGLFLDDLSVESPTTLEPTAINKCTGVETSSSIFPMESLAAKSNNHLVQFAPDAMEKSKPPRKPRSPKALKTMRAPKTNKSKAVKDTASSNESEPLLSPVYSFNCPLNAANMVDENVESDTLLRSLLRANQPIVRQENQHYEQTFFLDGPPPPMHHPSMSSASSPMIYPDGSPGFSYNGIYMLPATTQNNSLEMDSTEQPSSSIFPKTVALKMPPKSRNKKNSCSGPSSCPPPMATFNPGLPPAGQNVQYSPQGPWPSMTPASNDQFHPQQFYQTPRMQQQPQHISMQMYNNQQANPLNAPCTAAPVPGKKGLLKRKSATNALSSQTNKKQSTTPYNNTILNPYKPQTACQMYPSQDYSPNSHILSPFGSYDQQNTQQGPSSAPMGTQWAKRPNSRSDLNQMVRMELRNTVQARQGNPSSPSIGAHLSPPPPMANDRYGQSKMVEPQLMSPPRMTQAFQPSLGVYNENNNNSLSSSFYGAQAQRNCGQSVGAQPPQFFSSVSLDDCKHFIKTVDPSSTVDIGSLGRVELFDFNLGGPGSFDMDNDETRLLVQKLLQ